MCQKIKIYHNPECGTSRNTLALIRNSGQEPEIIEYLINPPSREELIDLIQDAGLSVRDALRTNVTPYTDLQLDDAKWTDDQLIQFMLLHPILINRPFVVTDLGVKLCRPSELVLALLSQPQRQAFSKEDGKVVIEHVNHIVR